MDHDPTRGVGLKSRKGAVSEAGIRKRRNADYSDIAQRQGKCSSTIMTSGQNNPPPLYSKMFYITCTHTCRLGVTCTLADMKPPVRKGPQGGRFQKEPKAKQKERYLLDKPIKTGPQGGKYQEYRGKKGKKKQRYLLHK